MSVAKFVAANGREAMRKVREAMGPDAVVLSNRMVDGGVEIVAMRDTDLGDVSDNAPAYVAPRLAAPVQAPQAVEPAQPDAQQAIGDLRGELQSMRALIERQMSGMGTATPAAPGGDPLREALFEWVVGAGFSGQLARTLISRLPVGVDRPAAMAWIRQEIAAKVPVLADDDAMFARGGVLALVGPTGVGKTTTTAKLAARFVLKHGPEKLALLTTDSFRIGAHEQLRIYGDILGVPVHAVKDAADLRFALAALAEKHLVIVDTVGMSQRDRSLSDQIAMLAGVQVPMQRVLLLNGTSHGDTLNEVVHAYRHERAEGGGLDGCIISKLDEATHLGSVLDVVIRHRLPVFYASTGQRVPEHLELAEGDKLVERAFLMPRRGSVFADAQAARASLPPVAAEADATRGADDVLRSITDSAGAVGVCVDALRGGGYGFDAVRTLWEQRSAMQTHPHGMSRQVREAACRDVGRHCDRHVLALTSTVAVPVAGRRAPQAWQHTLWLADRDGMPLAAAVEPVVRNGKGGWDDENAGLAAAIAATRTVVHVQDGCPGAAALDRWHAAGERWIAALRKTTRVISGGTAWKLDALADTLTFHATGDISVRGREAVQWIAQVNVRVVDAQARGARGAAPEGGIEASLVVARTVDRDNGQTIAVDYVACDPALDVDGGRVAQWMQRATAADAQCRALRHAIDHLGRVPADAAPDAQSCATIAAQQAGVMALRLEWSPVEAATGFLARLAGRGTGRDGMPSVAVLVEGIGRLMALLDVLENYPGRNDRSRLAADAEMVIADVADGELLAAVPAVEVELTSATDSDSEPDFRSDIAVDGATPGIPGAGQAPVVRVAPSAPGVLRTEAAAPVLPRVSYAMPAAAIPQTTLPRMPLPLSAQQLAVRMAQPVEARVAAMASLGD